MAKTKKRKEFYVWNYLYTDFKNLAQENLMSASAFFDAVIQEFPSPQNPPRKEHKFTLSVESVNRLEAVANRWFRQPGSKSGNQSNAVMLAMLYGIEEHRKQKGRLLHWQPSELFETKKARKVPKGFHLWDSIYDEFAKIAREHESSVSSWLDKALRKMPDPKENPKKKRNLSISLQTEATLTQIADQWLKGPGAKSGNQSNAVHWVMSYGIEHKEDLLKKVKPAHYKGLRRYFTLLGVTTYQELATLSGIEEEKLKKIAKSGPDRLPKWLTYHLDEVVEKKKIRETLKL